MNADTDLRRARRVAGYHLVLPPGWFRIPLRGGSAKAVRAAVNEALRAVPRDVPRDRIAPYRAELEGRLRAMVSRARAQGGVDVYLPLVPAHGIPISASFIVAEGAVGARDEIADPLHVVAYLATDPAAAVEGATTCHVTVDDTPAVRREHIAPPEADAGLDVGSRRVDYIVPKPGEPGRWLLVTYTTVGAGDPDDEFAVLLVQLFDAIMSTFRWTFIEADT